MRLPKIRADLEAIYQEHKADSTCAHPATELRRKTASNGAISFAHQCLACGYQQGGPVKHATLTAAQMHALCDWDNTLKEDFVRQRDERYAQKRDQAEQAAYREWLRCYRAYLASDEWQLRRKLVLLRAQGICEGCRSKPANDVHHHTYAHAGDEFLFELVALCRTCHERFHSDPAPSPSPPPPLALIEDNEDNCPF